jgi:LPS export ABC transporter permease LptF
MRFARTLSLYVIRETLLYCTLAFLVLTLVLLTQNLLRRLDELFLVGMTLADLRVVMACIFPIAISYAIPLAFLIGLLLAIRRLNTDGELLALRSIGFGPPHLLLPTLLLAAAASLGSAWLMNDIDYQARRQLVQLFKQVAARGAIIEPGKFRHVGAHLIFVEDRQRDGSLRGVMIYDRSQTDRRFRVFASRGRFEFDERSEKIQLYLREGDVHFDPREDAPDRYERIRFETLSYQLDVRHLLGMDFGPVRPKQMSLPELRDVLKRAERGDPLRELDQKDPVAYALEIHRRRALPLAPLVLAAVGLPIALASEHRGRNAGLLLVLVAAFAYYAAGAICEALAESGALGPVAANWLPNLIFGILGGVLIARSRRWIPV